MGGMTGLLLLLWAGVTVGSVVDLQKRIIGGRDCPDDERLYHVILKSHKGSDSSLCGGSLISAQWVLTAAHCWKGTTWTMTAYVGRSPATGMVIADHKIYKNGFLGKEHDLMLLRLQDTTTIPPVKLPDCKAPLKIGDEVQIAGHASTNVGPNNIRVGGESDTLQCTNTAIVKCDGLKKCLKNYLKVWELLSKDEEWLCFKRDNVDASPGDSGGGVVFKDMIYGVISFTDDGTRACVAAAASMNVCDTDYLNWIYKTTGIPKP